jgi:hypothetical protein
MIFISTKKVRIQTPDNIPNIHNILGMVPSAFGPTATILRDSFTKICITNTHSLQLFGAYNNFTIDLLAFPTKPQERITIGRTINQYNHQYHRIQFIWPNVLPPLPHTPTPCIPHIPSRSKFHSQPTTTYHPSTPCPYITEPEKVGIKLE